MQTAIRSKPGGAVQIEMKHTRIYILMVLAAFCWSGAFIAGKFAVPYIPTVSLTFGRFVVATVAMGFIKKYMEAKNPEEKYIFQKTDLKKFLFTGIVGMVGYHIFFFLSLKYTTAINSSIIGATNPVVTALLALAFLKQKLPLKQVLGIVLSLFGVVLTITAGDLSVLAAFELNKGDLIMCLAVVVWAAYGVYSKSRCAGISPVAITYYSFLVCTLVLIPFVLLEKPWEFLPGVPAEAYIPILFLLSGTADRHQRNRTGQGFRIYQFGADFLFCPGDFDFRRNFTTSEDSDCCTDHCRGMHLSAFWKY